jgi:wax ester synthase-like acyl-CoA acyltransferase family protein
VWAYVRVGGDDRRPALLEGEPERDGGGGDGGEDRDEPADLAPNMPAYPARRASYDRRMTKRLSPSDAMFLYSESREQMLHGGLLMPFTPAPDSPPDLLRGLMERAAQRAAGVRAVGPQAAHP